MIIRDTFKETDLAVFEEFRLQYLNSYDIYSDILCNIFSCIISFRRGTDSADFFKFAVYCV